jgi:hypothetical protein
MVGLGAPSIQSPTVLKQHLPQINAFVANKTIIKTVYCSPGAGRAFARDRYFAAAVLLCHIL